MKHRIRFDSCRAVLRPLRAGLGRRGVCPAVLAILASACAPQGGETVRALPQRLGGDWTAAPGAQVVNQYAALASDVAAGVAAIQLSDAAALDDALGAALGAGDWLLLYQAQGASIDTSDSRSYGQVQALGGAGSFEFVEVQQVVGNQVELSCALSQPFTTSGHTQVVRVPRFSQLVVPSGSSLTAPAWAGTTGGIVALQANALVLDGTISASGLGFRGGATDGAAPATRSAYAAAAQAVTI